VLRLDENKGRLRETSGTATHHRLCKQQKFLDTHEKSSEMAEFEKGHSYSGRSAFAYTAKKQDQQ